MQGELNGNQYVKFMGNEDKLKRKSDAEKAFNYYQLAEYSKQMKNFEQPAEFYQKNYFYLIAAKYFQNNNQKCISDETSILLKLAQLNFDYGLLHQQFVILQQCLNKRK
eukprot:TRINITY_DN32258_c0_g1_i1.p3 TRINITY_DN32258_c0_g1~~TRINITY_DN32258_c0_g1_i1.p3  ORF type:complete len:109 (+),score=18.72 TRINITY_DN32258_c0_g1_i1:131-457(+)